MPLNIGICSFSFHRTCASGAMDFAGIARTCKELGCTQLDPWNAHLGSASGAASLRAGRTPQDARLGLPGPGEVEAAQRAAQAVGLGFGCIAVDGAHIVDADAAVARDNRERARAWIGIARQLGAQSVRIDAGGPEELSDAQLAAIRDGYRELIELAGGHGVRVIMENHWGPSQIPENVVRILEAVPGLGLLFDTHNWKKGLQREGWERCARFAEVVHVKTFTFDAAGEEATVDLKPAFALLGDHAFAGSWCVESVPADGDEVRAARDTIALIRRHARPAASAARAGTR